jgi:hypothetical protein
MLVPIAAVILSAYAAALGVSVWAAAAPPADDRAVLPPPVPEFPQFPCQHTDQSLQTHATVIPPGSNGTNDGTPLAVTQPGSVWAAAAPPADDRAVLPPPVPKFPQSATIEERTALSAEFAAGVQPRAASSQNGIMKTVGAVIAIEQEKLKKAAAEAADNEQRNNDEGTPLAVPPPGSNGTTPLAVTPPDFSWLSKYFELRNAKGDGNCLFHSLAMALAETHYLPPVVLPPVDAVQLRTAIVDSMKTPADIAAMSEHVRPGILSIDFTEQLTSEQRKTFGVATHTVNGVSEQSLMADQLSNAQVLDAYRNFMRTSGNYGTELEIHQFAKLYKRHVRVLFCGLAPNLIHTAVYGEVTDPPLFLLQCNNLSRETWALTDTGKNNRAESNLHYDPLIPRGSLRHIEAGVADPPADTLSMRGHVYENTAPGARNMYIYLFDEDASSMYSLEYPHNPTKHDGDPGNSASSGREFVDVLLAVAGHPPNADLGQMEKQQLDAQPERIRTIDEKALHNLCEYVYYNIALHYQYNENSCIDINEIAGWVTAFYTAKADPTETRENLEESHTLEEYVIAQMKKKGYILKAHDYNTGQPPVS